MDVVGEEDTDLLEKICTQEQISQVRKAVLEQLDERERQVIILRYGLSGKKPQRQREVAKNLDISRSYVSRIEKKALQKLKVALSDSKWRSASHG